MFDDILKNTLENLEKHKKWLLEKHLGGVSLTLKKKLDIHKIAQAFAHTLHFPFILLSLFKWKLPSLKTFITLIKHH